MKSSKASRIMSAAAFAAVASSAAAADDSGWYIGGNAGQSLSKIDNRRIEAGLADSGLSTVSIEDANRHFAYKLFGGYQFNPYLSLEGGYFDLGKFGFTAQTFPQGTLRGELKLQGANFDLVGTLPIAHSFAIFGRVGANYADVKDSFTGSGSVVLLEPRDSKREVNYKLGLGVQYDLTRFLRLRAEAERYRISDPVEGKADVEFFSVGLSYRFGTHTAIANETPSISPAPAAEPAPVVVPVVTPDQRYCTILDIEFEINRDEIQREDKERLGVVGAFMNKYPQTTAVIEGHTDNVGTPEANMTLSKDRAASVVRYLEDTFGISPNRLKAEGYGDTRPRGDNSTEQGKRLNRRIDAVIACATDIAGLAVARARVTVATVIDFEENAAVIAPKYRDDLVKVADFLKENPTITATVEGHTGNLQKTPESAMNISTLRAQSVVDYLVNQLSVPRSQLTAEGFGETRRFAYSTSVEGRRENRRVNIILNYPK